MLKVLMGGGNIQEQKGNVIREVETLRLKEILEIKITVIKMKNAF